MYRPVFMASNPVHVPSGIVPVLPLVCPTLRVLWLQVINELIHIRHPQYAHELVTTDGKPDRRMAQADWSSKACPRCRSYFPLRGWPRMRQVSCSASRKRETMSDAASRTNSMWALEQFFVRSQITLGDAPRRMLRSWKSESLETIVSPFSPAYFQITESSDEPSPYFPVTHL